MSRRLLETFREKIAISPDLEAETERLLGGRTREIKLSGRLLQLYLEKSWPQRSKITRAWAVWVPLIGLCCIPLSYMLAPHALVITLIIALMVVPGMHGCLYWIWSRPRAGWVEGLSIVMTAAVFMVSIGIIGIAAGGINIERFATGALFFVTIGVMVFAISEAWSLALAFSGVSLFFAVVIIAPEIRTQEALALAIYYGIGNTSVVVARQTINILNQRQFLMSLRDRYRSRELSEANARLEKLATCDSLTGLANRRSAAASLAKIWADPAMPKSGVAFIMADIDNFKSLNDTAGHAAGDDCIARVARTIEAAVRTEDIICRHGGEEFLVVLTNVTPENAWDFAERIRTGVEAQGIVNPGLAIPGNVTISLGVAFAADDVAPEHVVKRADEALYDAKNGGRNRVFLAAVQTLDPCPVDAVAPSDRASALL